MMPLFLADIDWQFIAFIIFLVVSYLVRMFGKGQEEEQPAHPAEEERARRLQEEIRRAIEERRRQQEESQPGESPQHPGHPATPPPLPAQRTAPPPQPPAMPSSRRTLPQDHTPPRPIPPPKPAPARVVTPRAAILEEEGPTTHTLQEMYDMELKAAMAKNSLQGAFPEETTTVKHTFDYLREISSPDNGRKAMVYREIFGPPRALRPH